MFRVVIELPACRGIPTGSLALELMAELSFNQDMSEYTVTFITENGEGTCRITCVSILVKGLACTPSPSYI